MSNFVVSPESLVNMVRQMTDGLLRKRLENRAKSYVKVDFHALEHDNKHFGIQVTMCSSCSANLTLLLTEALRSQLRSQTLDNHAVVATIEEKSLSTLRVQKVVCTRNSSVSLVSQPDLDSADSCQKEFSLLKRYVCIKLRFQVESVRFDTFASLLLCHIMEIEQIDPNVKFSFRKDNQYVYRNRVRMDDIILSCMLLSSYCANIVQKSEDDSFRKHLMDSLELTKVSDFEKRVGCLLLAQADRNFIVPVIKAGKNNGAR